MDDEKYTEGVMGASHVLTFQLACLLIKAGLIDRRELAGQLRECADPLPVGGAIESVLRDWAKMFDSDGIPSWTPGIIQGGKSDDDG